MFVYCWKSWDPLNDASSVFSFCSVSRALKGPSDVMFNLSTFRLGLPIGFGWFSAWTSFLLVVLYLRFFLCTKYCLSLWNSGFFELSRNLLGPKKCWSGIAWSIELLFLFFLVLNTFFVLYLISKFIWFSNSVFWNFDMYSCELYLYFILSAKICWMSWLVLLCLSLSYCNFERFWVWIFSLVAHTDTWSCLLLVPPLFLNLYNVFRAFLEVLSTLLVIIRDEFRLYWAPSTSRSIWLLLISHNLGSLASVFN